MKHADNTQKPKAINKRGFALIFVLGFAAVLAIFTASIGAQAAFNLRTVEKRGEADSAYYAASTGTQISLSLLREPIGDWLQTDAVVGVPGNGVGPDVLAHTYHNFPGFHGALGTDPAPDGTIVPLDHFYIISLGIANGVDDGSGTIQGGSRFEMTTMGTSVKPSFPTMPQAAFGFEGIDINGTVDHFDSRAVPEGPQVVGTFPASVDPMLCEQAEASVGTNTITPADIVVGPQAKIDGHLLLKWDATDAEVISVASALGSSYDTTTAVVNFAQAGAPSAMSPNTNTDTNGINGEVARVHTNKITPSVDPNAQASALPYPAGANVTLDEGNTYYKAGDLNVGAGDTITVADTDGDGFTEDVMILVDDNIQFTGSVNGVNGTAQPRRLKIFSLATSGPSLFQMTGSTAHCLVTGADLDVVIDKDSELWGAVMGKTVTLEGDGSSQGKIHFDVALRDPYLVADLYDYVLSGTVLTANVTTGDIATPPPAAAPPAAPAPGVAPAPAAAPSGCGCGCGCGGSMMLALKSIEEEIAAY